MDIQDQWEKALKSTEVIRPRVMPLSTFSATQLPYIFLAESSVNLGDSVVRKGEVLVEKPSILLPGDFPHFEGFEGEKGDVPNLDMLTSLLFVRGVRFPSMRYNNKTHSLEVFEGKLNDAVSFYEKQMRREENTAAGIVIGPEDLWQLSVLIFIGNQMIRQADGDMRKMLDEWRRQQEGK